MTLDFTSLANAIAQLQQALEIYSSDKVSEDPVLQLHIRAAAIQAFGFTYELAFKMLKRYLGTVVARPEEVNGMTFDAVVREGYALGLLNAEIAEWRNFRKDRGTTSHAYDSGKAEYVFENIPAFLAEAKYLLQQLEAKQTLA